MAHAEKELDGGERLLTEKTLKLRIGPDGEPSQIRLQGELDLASAATLEREIRRAEATSPRSLVIDVSDLDFIDSTGLAVLVHAAHRAAANGTSFGLLGGNGHIQRVLELSGLGDALPSFD